jgi:hypothetical protein
VPITIFNPSMSIGISSSCQRHWLGALQPRFRRNNQPKLFHTTLNQLNLHLQSITYCHVFANLGRQRGEMENDGILQNHRASWQQPPQIGYNPTIGPLILAGRWIVHVLDGSKSTCLELFTPNLRLVGSAVMTRGACVILLA